MSDPWGHEWTPPPVPWGQHPPGWVPPDPVEVAYATRQRALRYGVISLALLPLAVLTFLAGLFTLIFGIGAVLAVGALLMILLSGALAVSSVVQLARTPYIGRSRFLPMIPALLTLLAMAAYVGAGVLHAFSTGGTTGG